MHPLQALLRTAYPLLCLLSLVLLPLQPPAEPPLLLLSADLLGLGGRPEFRDNTGEPPPLRPRGGA